MILAQPLRPGFLPIAVGAADVDRAELGKHGQHRIERIRRGIVGVDQQATLRLWRVGSSVMVRLSAGGGGRDRAQSGGRRLRALSSYSRRHQQQACRRRCWSVTEWARRRQRIAWARNSPAWRASVTSMRMLTAPAIAPSASMQRRRVGGEHHPGAVGPLGERRRRRAPRASRVTATAIGHSSWGSERAVVGVELPGHAPAILADRRRAAGESRCRPG